MDRAVASRLARLNGILVKRAQALDCDPDNREDMLSEAHYKMLLTISRNPSVSDAYLVRTGINAMVDVVRSNAVRDSRRHGSDEIVEILADTSALSDLRAVEIAISVEQTFGEDGLRAMLAAAQGVEVREFAVSNGIARSTVWKIRQKIRANALEAGLNHDPSKTG